ncbi:hypothetical protein SETIT_6G228500v2 [Setaria italica]|uniref:Reverse transcriptase zinc-binding domain-containing protein n=1 Tax=Setaria italica TaxID=4555 RepID=K3YMC5_SETIT|nr:hypothetical protein SETIT_6G228500v2 [Setaria italica]
MLTPEPSASRLSKWWWLAISSVPKEVRRGLNSLIILVAWEVWKHRNSCVFENARPCTLWCSAGARKLQELLLRSPTLGI